MNTQNNPSTLDHFGISHTGKETLPALTPLHWCWYDPTWWPWLWTEFWAECWWWEYAHTPERRPRNEVNTLNYHQRRKYPLSDISPSEEDSWTDLEQVGPDTLVSTLLSNLLGQPRDLVGGLSDVFGALDESALVSAASTHQTRHFSHQQGHSLGGTDDVISLET